MSFTAPVSSFPEKVYETKEYPGKVALIDADRYKHVVTYRMYQRVMEDGEERTKALVREIVDDYLYEDIFSKFKAKANIFCFSAPSKDVFRNHISQEKQYKGNRYNKPDNYFYEGKYEDTAYVFEYINDTYPTLVFDDLEADDILSMLQNEDDTFIFSHDKDLKQVPGWHFNMNDWLLEYTTEEEGFAMLMDQMLTGDTTDNIPGLKGFGPKALEKFREECFGFGDRELLIATLDKYIEKHGAMLGMDIFSEMWHLLSMRVNRGDYCLDKYQKGFILLKSFIDESH